MKEGAKWAISTVAVLTLPIWGLPALVASVIYTFVKSFKEEVLDD